MASAFLGFFRSDHWLVRQLASVRLTVILLVLVGLACVLGTLIPQAAMSGLPPEGLYRYYTEQYGPSVHNLFNTLSFYHLFSSLWFSALLVLLVINMVFCSLNRFRARWRQIGFQLTHFSIVFLLIGVVAGLNRPEGRMQIYEGEQADTMLESPKVPVANSLEEARRITAGLMKDDAALVRQLGFSIQLDDFVLERHTEPLDRIRFQAVRSTGRKGQAGSRPKRFNLAYQKRFVRPVGEPWDIEVLDTQPVHRSVSRVAASQDESAGPAVEIELRSGGRSQSGWLFAGLAQSRLRLLTDAEIEYTTCATEADLERLVAQDRLPTASVPDRVEVSLGADPVTTLPLKVGAEQAVAGTSVTLTVLRFFPDFKLDANRRPFTASNHRHNPAIEVRLRRDAEVGTQWVFARIPEFSRPISLGATTVNLRFLEGSRQQSTFLRIVDYPQSGERHLQQYVDGSLVKATPADTGTTVAITDDIELRLGRWFDHATRRSEKEIDPGRVAARLRVRNLRTGQSEEMAVRSGEVAEKGRLRFMVEREYPIKQFISKVRVFEDGKEVLKKTIQMNDPLKYGGFTFYQSSYDSQAGEASRYTILSAKHDPGIWFIYWGFGMLTAGLVIVFYINPFLRKRSGEKEE